MTKKEIVKIIKRYPYVVRAIKEGESKSVFYIGNRKNVIEITDDVKIVCNLIKLVYEQEQEEYIKKMIKDILSGDSNINIIQKGYFCRNTFIGKKRAFSEKVYNCCIARGLVTFEEIIKEKIA